MHPKTDADKAHAYVLISVEPGQLEKVVAALRDTKHVVTADVLIGPYDIIALIETPDLRDIGRMVLDEIHRIAGIKRTTICILIY